MKRRIFLKGMGLGLSGIIPATRKRAIAEGAFPNVGALAETPSGSEIRADVLIIGGGTGGCGAALAALRNGLSVIMTEETDWIGGQLTAQAIPPDEFPDPWLEAFIGTASYREFRSRSREYYRRNYPLTAKARAIRNLNPGNGVTSSLSMEPRVALAVLYEMFAPYLSGARLMVLGQHKAVSADTQGDFVKAVTVRSLTSGRQVVLTAPYILDATELGDLLPMTHTEYVTGFESRKQTGEPHAATEAEPNNMQAFTCSFAMDYIEGENHTIEKPVDYDFWRNFKPHLKPPWPGLLLSFTESYYKQASKPYTEVFDPVHENNMPDGIGLMRYRRIADKRNFAPGTYRGDITLVNWEQNDYFLGSLYEVSEQEAAQNLRRGKQLSLSLLYWLQTEAPRPDGGVGWPELRLRKDIVGTEDGLTKCPYIREARRIKAEFTVLEQHLGTDARMQITGKKRDEVQAETFPDSVGVGRYPIDLHATTGGDNFIELSSLPFQIPLGALIPQRVENLLPACKNTGTTHLTNGCFRLHPEEWNLGEAVGMLVTFCLSKRTTPRQVRNNAKLLNDFQHMLTSQGFVLQWPRIGPT